MKLQTTILAVAILVSVGLVAAAADERQFYTDWRPQDRSKTQWLCKYCFKANPEASDYQYQWVVWNKKWPDKVFYMNKDEKYWCAAPIGHKDEAWLVFNTKVGRLTEVQLPDKSILPPIPGSQEFDNVKMSFPKFIGLPIAANP